MELYKITDNTGITHMVHIGWNRLLANDEIGIFVHCTTRNFPNRYYHKLGAFSHALSQVFGNDRLVKVN